MSQIFKDFQKEAIVRFLALKKYNMIREKLYSCNISKDEDFQRNFNAFFRVRRGEEWQREFYNYFETVKKNTDIKFEDILWHLYEATGNVEASFSSKMLATINHNMPIWDKFIVKKFNIKVLGQTKEEQIEDIIKKYYEIYEKEHEELEKPEVKQAIQNFKKEFAEYDLSDIKILDYILWNDRNEE